MRQIRKGVKPDRLSIPDHSFVVRLQSTVAPTTEAFLNVQTTSGHQASCGFSSYFFGIREVVREDCLARKLNKEDAMDRSKWRKLIKDVR